MSYIVRQGDPTTTGGTVLQGNGALTVQDKPATIEGMQASCPSCPAAIGVIKALGPRNLDISGVPVIVHGDQVQCGCPPGSNLVQATQSIAEATA